MNSNTSATEMGPHPGAVDKDSANFDMADSDRELAEFARLRSMLEECRGVGTYYARVNADALRLLRWHRVLVFSATFFGYGAVLFAVWQLSGAPWPTAPVVGSLEFVFAVAATVAVLSGMWAAVDHRWRLRRLQAEAARFIKFNYLLNHGQVIANGKPVQLDEMIKARLAELSPKSVRDWVRRELTVLDLGEADDLTSRWTEAELAELTSYYSKKRIQFQRDYFAFGERHRHKWEHVTKRIAIACFFVSVLAACAHFWWDEIVKHFFHIELPPAFGGELAGGKQLDVLSFILLLVAACLPVLGAALRNFRAAHEFGRNENRYCALRIQLGEFEKELGEAETAQEKFDIMFRVEESLEYEHRSWQRLMVEAEWFG